MTHLPPSGSTAYCRLLGALVFAGVATFAQLYSPQGVLPQTADDLGTSPDRAALTVSAVTLGGVPALAMADLNDEVHPRAAAVVTGWFVGGTAVGGLLGRLITTPVADLTSWGSA